MRQSGTEDTADISNMFHVIRGSNILFCPIFSLSDYNSIKRYFNREYAWNYV